MGRVIPVLVGLVALGIAVAFWLHWRGPIETPSPHAAPTADYDHARTLLAQLPVKG